MVVERKYDGGHLSSYIDLEQEARDCIKSFTQRAREGFDMEAGIWVYVALYDDDVNLMCAFLA